MGHGRGRRVNLEDRQEAISQIKKAKKSGCKISSACKAMGISTRTYERWCSNPNGDNRKGPLTEPANKLSVAERQEIIATATSEKYRDKSAAQIVPLLADEGTYIASEASFYRILKNEKMDAHRRRSKPPTKKKPMELIATGPNQVYSWDITYLQSSVRGMFFFLYFFMDVYSRKIVGYTVENEQSAEHAAATITNICVAEDIKEGDLVLHTDNGGPMKGATMLATLQWLGVVPSFSRPSVSNDNPYSESLFKTVKYCPQYPSKPFESKESAEAWVADFVHWYNEEQLHSGISFVTPASRHRGEDLEILEKRDLVYKQAKSKHPNRWSGATKNWGHIGRVFLNHLHGKETSCNKKAA